MEETKVLQMIFANSAGSKVTISIADPRDDLIATEVEAAMNNIITTNAIESTGGDLIAVVGARIVNRQVTELIA